MVADGIWKCYVVGCYRKACRVLYLEMDLPGIESDGNDVSPNRKGSCRVPLQDPLGTDWKAPGSRAGRASGFQEERPSVGNYPQQTWTVWEVSRPTTVWGVALKGGVGGYSPGSNDSITKRKKWCQELNILKKSKT